MWSSFSAKTVGIIVALALLGAITLLLSVCGSAATSTSQPESATSSSQLKEVALEVPTISCSTCKPRVEASAKSVPGVREVRFDSRRIDIVYITYDLIQISPQAIVEAIERGGDKVSKVIEQ